jgi:hypothetical protein
MLKKSITYETYSGEKVTEDFYFNLTKAELVELEMSHKGGLGESLKKIIASEDGGEIIKEFKGIILKSYGKKSDDGRRFVKNQQLREEFESTEAYSVLFMELVTDADAASEFVNKVIPQDLAGEAQMALSSRTEEEIPSNPEFAPAQVHPLNPQPRKLSQIEITEMDADELKSGLTSGRYEL